MKLLHCAHCREVFNLDYEVKTCKCGATKGKYLKNGIDAVYSGEWSTPLGFANQSFVDAIVGQPDEGWGKRFEAFVIPEKCDTFVKIGDVE